MTQGQQAIEVDAAAGPVRALPGARLYRVSELAVRYFPGRDRAEQREAARRWFADVLTRFDRFAVRGRPATHAYAPLPCGILVGEVERGPGRGRRRMRTDPRAWAALLERVASGMAVRAAARETARLAGVHNWSCPAARTLCMRIFRFRSEYPGALMGGRD